jgi:hypothetical protein
MSAPEPTPVSVYYRWRDAQGLDHIVDSVDKVPEASRASAERVALMTSARKEDPATSLFGVRIDWESFGAGFAAAFALGFVFVLARRAKNTYVELAVVVAVAAVIAGVYFGWVRQKSAEPSPPHAVQSVQIDDPKSVPDKPRPKPAR